MRVGGVEVAAVHRALLCLFGSKRLGTGSYSRPSPQATWLKEENRDDEPERPKIIRDASQASQPTFADARRPPALADAKGGALQFVAE